jgi:hypothetical protein
MGHVIMHRPSIEVFQTPSMEDLVTSLLEKRLAEILGYHDLLIGAIIR